MGLANNRPRVGVISVPSAGLTTATTAYTSGDMLGTEQTVSMGVGSGMILGCVCTDASAVLASTGVEIFLFSAASTPAADNAANSWADADMANLVAHIPLTRIVTSALNVVVATAVDFTGVPFFSPSATLYMNVVTRSGNAVFAGGATSLNYKIYAQAL